MQEDESNQNVSEFRYSKHCLVHPFCNYNSFARTVLSHSMDPDLLNLRQLRVELKRRGLSPSGLKADLLKRLKEGVHVPPISSNILEDSPDENNDSLDNSNDITSVAVKPSTSTVSGSIFVHNSSFIPDQSTFWFRTFNMTDCCVLFL